MKTKKKKIGCLTIIIIVILIAVIYNVIGGKTKKDTDNIPSVETSAAEKISESVTEPVTETTISETDEEEMVPSESNTEVSTDTSVLENVIRPEFKEFMDSYETFYDEYIAFMVKYNSADSSDMLGMMTDYMIYLEKYSEFTEKLDAIDESELTDAEALYYAEVTMRVSQKMLQAAY